MVTQGRMIAEGLAAAWSSRDPEKIASFFTKDCIFEDVIGRDIRHGQEELKDQAKHVYAQIPDLMLKIDACYSSKNGLGCEWT